MKKLIVLLLLAAGFSTVADAQSSCVKLQEADGQPRIPCLTQLTVPNGSLTQTGSKGTLTFSGGAGDVVGPASSTDNAIARFDSTTGKLLQNSSVTISDAGALLAPDGSITNAAYSFTSSVNTGLYRVSANEVAFAVGGVQAMRIRDSSTIIPFPISVRSNTTPSITFGSTPDTSLDRTVAASLRVGNASTGAGSFIVGPSTASVGTSGVGVLVVGGSTAPTTAPADEFQVYSVDFEGVAADARMHVRAEAGNPVAIGNSAVAVPAPAATTGASQAGRPVTLRSSNAVASTDTAGAAAGGDVNITAGNAARLTSGNANGGNVTITPGTGIGTGTAGNLLLATGLFQLGGTTGSFPALKASGTTLQARTADDGGYTTVQAGNFSAITNVVLVNTTSLLTAGGDTALERPAALVWGFTDTGATLGGTFRARATTPAQIAADQNDYNPGGTSYFQRWSSDASRNVTGLTFTVPQVDGQVHAACNVGAQNIVIVNQSASSTAANRFLNSTGANLTLAADKCADVIYDGTTQRWRASLRN